MIKNRYLLPYDKSLDWLKQAKCFTQLELNHVDHWMKIKKGDK